MKIFGLGFSRTGTTTLNETLNNMGYKVRHYPRPKSAIELAALKGGSINSQEPNTQYDGATDIPVIPFCKEEWLTRIEKYFEEKRNVSHLLGYEEIMRKTVYGDVFFDRKKYEQAWDRHDKEVREYCKNRPNDFLILDILGGSDKPKKLYDFLEHDNPPEEFSHWNKKTS
jgi:hypothetical protein